MEDLQAPLFRYITHEAQRSLLIIHTLSGELIANLTGLPEFEGVAINADLKTLRTTTEVGAPEAGGVQVLQTAPNALLTALLTALR